MVKNLELGCTIEGTTTQRFFDVVYAPSAPTVEYHRITNQDPDAKVGAWENGVRRIDFSMPLRMPQFVKTLVGAEAVKVRETQSVVWHNSSRFSITSDTQVLNVPGGNRFQTFLSMSVSEAAGGGAGGDGAGDVAPCVELSFAAKCVASMPWPMAASIENVMIENAQSSMRGFFDFCNTLMAEAGPAGGAGAEAAPKAAAAEAGEAAGGSPLAGAHLAAGALEHATLSPNPPRTSHSLRRVSTRSTTNASYTQQQLQALLPPGGAEALLELPPMEEGGELLLSPSASAAFRAQASFFQDALEHFEQLEHLEHSLEHAGGAGGAQQEGRKGSAPGSPPTAGATPDRGAADSATQQQQQQQQQVSQQQARLFQVLAARGWKPSDANGPGGSAAGATGKPSEDLHAVVLAVRELQKAVQDMDQKLGRVLTQQQQRDQAAPGGITASRGAARGGSGAGAAAGDSLSTPLLGEQAEEGEYNEQGGSWVDTCYRVLRYAGWTLAACLGGYIAFLCLAFMALSMLS